MGVVRLACSAMEPWLERAASAWPPRVALDSPSGSLTYASLRDRASSFAASPGDRVAIALPFGLDFAVAVHACLFRGAVAVPIDGRLSERERTAQVREAGIVIDAPLRAAATSPPLAAGAPAPQPPPAAAAPAHETPPADAAPAHEAPLADAAPA